MLNELTPEEAVISRNRIQAGSTLNVASLAGDAVIDTVAVGGNRTVSLPGGSGQTQRWNLKTLSI